MSPMRFTLAAVLLASTAQAETITVPTQPTAVTVFPGLAQISRQTRVDLPAGQHRLVLTGVPGRQVLQAPTVKVRGAQVLGMVARPDSLVRFADSAAVRVAQQRVDQLEQQIAQTRDRAAEARAAGQGAQTSLGFLAALGSNEGLAGSDVSALQDISRMIATEAQAALSAQVRAEAVARAIEVELKAQQEALAVAAHALENARREDGERLYVAVDIAVQTAGEAQIDLSYYMGGEIEWRPSYELHLATGEDAQLQLKRSVVVTQDTGENWQDVDLALSNVVPMGKSAPAIVPPLLHRIEEPRSLRKRAESDMRLAQAPAAEPILFEADQGSWQRERSDVGVSYHLRQPVSVATGLDQVTLVMDVLQTEAEMRAEAAPLYDAVAYRMVTFTNSFGERLLGAFEVPYFVDGQLVALANFADLADGAEAEIGFGPIHGLTVRRDVLRQNEGDRGVISRQELREQVVEIEVENVTGQDWELRILDRVPFGQQEDLEITWQASPSPSVVDVDKKPGVLAWDLNLVAGEVRKLSLETELRWPEGMVLR